MIAGLANGLFDFQEKAVLQLIDFAANKKSKQTVVMKSPTGSGKTLILIDFLDEYLTHADPNTAFIWLCPGKGNLEEQSRKKMEKHCPLRGTQSLFDALLSGFPAGSTTFINWELVTKSGNKALLDGERKNLFDRIAEAHRAHTTFIVIIDEEHSNNTSKAKGIIDAFSAKNIIRVSATAVKNNMSEYFEIDETDVIGAGLITKAIYVNEGIPDGIEIEDDFDYLLGVADAKRKEISECYKNAGKNIRPLVLIQFPNGQPETVSAVENKLAGMGYTYENGMVSKWMSGDKKDLPDNLTENDGIPVFLLMKQAISTGWDCPRAKILVKLREGMSESFEIQTIGRLRRMPEARHYENDLLDFCYVYTFDDKFKAGMLDEERRAYIPKRLFLKDRCKGFRLEKQSQSEQFGGLGGREVLVGIHGFFIKKYKLGKDGETNKRLLSELGGYDFGDKLTKKFVEDTYVLTDSLQKHENYFNAYKNINTHTHSIYLLHAIDEMSSALFLQRDSVKTILKRLFHNNTPSPQKLISLNSREFYAFVINNEKLLKRDFNEVTANIAKQSYYSVKTVISNFKIPEQDNYRYDPSVKGEKVFSKNAYEGYTSGFVTSAVRSTSEMLLERYLETREDIDWVYKNGDSGQQYFSIVYFSGRQRLFYPDYIVMKKDGSVFVLETKGGEFNGRDKNVDIQAENKFNALKDYAEKHNIGWGFVRDRDGELYINDTAWTDGLTDESWKTISEAL